MLPQHSFQNSNLRRVYSHNDSHRFMDPKVIQIPSQTQNPSNLIKQKEAIFHDLIGIDNDDDSKDLVLFGEKVGKSNKGKTIESIHDDYGDHQITEMFDDIFSPAVIMDKSGPGSMVESLNGFTSVSHNLVNVDGLGSDQSYDDDDYSDLYSDDFMDVDNYSLLQAHFDNVNIPPGIEAPIPWLAEHDLGSKKTESSSLLYPSYNTQSGAKYSKMTDASQPSWSLAPTNPEIQGPLAGSPSLQTKVKAIDHTSGSELSSPLVFSQIAPSNKKVDVAQHRISTLKLASAAESSKSMGFLGPLGKMKPTAFCSSTNHGFVDNPEAMKLPHGGKSPHWGLFEGAKEAAGSSSSYHSKFIGPVGGSLHFPGIEYANPWLKNSFHLNPFPIYTSNSSYMPPFVPLHAPSEQVFDNTRAHNSGRDGNNGTIADSTVVTISDEVRDEILRKFQNFKQFDTIEDTSDHYFVRANSSMKQHSKNWGKRIQDEWKLLEKDLPDSIYVRVYESRIDLLRAVIIGAEGTPYHDGLFFFDVFFPSGYPTVPPDVHYHSGGLRLNPNLYNCGKVCLSLLNTWSGNKDEKWLPGVSTILQVLVSIQGLILNAKPYFNEPGYERMCGSAYGEMRSLRYNEDTFFLSLRTMVYLIRRPPKNFEDFVVGHFFSRAHDILVACKAYMEGAQVGCLVKGGVQDVDQGDKSCSKQFKNYLTAYVDMLVKEFTQIGAKDCEKFLASISSKEQSIG